MSNIKVKHGIYVSKPPRTVFSFLADPAKITLWQSSSYKVAPTGKGAKAAGGAKLKPGVLVQDQRNVFGKDIDGQWEVAEFVQDKKLVFRMLKGNIKWQMAFTLEPHEGGTLLSAEGGGDLGKIALTGAAANKAGQDMIENDLKTLAVILEKG